MHASVYKSQRRADTYVYLAARDAFEVLPGPLRDSLGALTWVMDLQLEEGRRLAQANPVQVRAELAERGFYLQVPPSVVSMLPPR
ncbi:YcgL domain-containing protein [Stenotrophomonas sp. C3(2023)]|uniref:YcgL domain-containing protein n=1 Tax=Stenotrophomonas sp. C3(2023) TaxID=3080277 RepID=UPI00293CB885|nr:YcgL domain-containing protein [Stenotrophomonas sp. C3(2023)]MDV3470092.1 YcgL domain-containing protein [Stenotrophomonas sp. C3(2023)]